jgi:hypothetical protein
MPVLRFFTKKKFRAIYFSTCLSGNCTEGRREGETAVFAYLRLELITESVQIDKADNCVVFYVLFILLLAPSSPIRRIFTSSSPIILSSKGLYMTANEQ